MRNFIISSACLLMLLGIWTSFTFYSSLNAEACAAELNTIIRQLSHEETHEEAFYRYGEFKRKWISYKETSSYFLDAGELNNIDTALVRAEYSMNSGNVLNTGSQLLYARNYILQLSESQRYSLKNIL